MNKKKIAIVTGANGGLGAEFTKLLNSDPSLDEIIILGRDEEKLNFLVTQLGSKIKPYTINLASRLEINEFANYLNKLDAEVKILINNAGYGKFCSYDDLDMNETLAMIDVNICAVVSLSLICLPLMPKGAHIINIASQAGFQPVPYMNVYAATKAFVKNYSKALNVELKDKGICVTAVCPGWVKTPFLEKSATNSPKSAHHFWFPVTPDAVAKKALDDAYKGKDISIYGIYVNFCHIFSKILPEKIIMKLWLLQQRIK